MNYAKIRKVGNGVGVLLSKKLLEFLGWKQGEYVYIDYKVDEIILKKIR